MGWTRWLAGGLLAALVLVLPTGAGAQPAPGPGPRFVVVQRAAHGVDQFGIEAPSLEEQGFERLPVPDGVDPAEFARQLEVEPGVLSAAADAYVYAAETPDDPLYSLNQSAYLGELDAPAAWDIHTGDEEVVVAVLDSGTDLYHEDLSGRLWENPRDADTDGIDDDGNGCVDDRYGCRFVEPSSVAGCGYASSGRIGDVRDDHGVPGSSEHSHGTLVAGIIGAAGDNGTGIAGVAWNVRIMTVKVLDCGPGGGAPRGTMSNVASGIDYARRMGADVINLSLASNPGDTAADLPSLRRAVEDARTEGILIVAAAGNHGPAATQVSPGYPAAYTQYDNVIAVGASDNQRRWATFSNYGPAVDFAAPGVGIVGTTRTDLAGSTHYGVASAGTSFSTPIVSGMFALMVSRNPRADYSEHLAQARAAASAAQPATHGTSWAGSGIIDIGESLERVPMTVNGSALRDWMDVPAGATVTATIDGKECARTTSGAMGPSSVYSLRVKADGESIGCGSPGKTVTFSIDGVPAVPALEWAGRNESLAEPDVDITTISPLPGPIVTQQLSTGLSNIAHLDDGGPPGEALASLAVSWSYVYAWDPLRSLLGSAGAYELFAKGVPGLANSLEDLGQYEAIWIDAAGQGVTYLNPNPPPGRAVELVSGWNSVVYTGLHRQVEDALSSIDGSYTKVMQFDNVDNEWRSYFPGEPRYTNDFGGLFRFKVYWIYTTEPGTLVMD